MPGRAAFGCVVSFGTATGTTTTTTLTNVTNISGLDGETESIDVTSHDSSGPIVRWWPASSAPGEVTLDVNFDPTSATHKAASGGVMWLRDQRLIVPWQVTFPQIGGNITKVAFQAFVKNTTVDAPYDDKLGMSVSLAADWLGHLDVHDHMSAVPERLTGYRLNIGSVQHGLVQHRQSSCSRPGLPVGSGVDTLAA